MDVLASLRRHLVCGDVGRNNLSIRLHSSMLQQIKYHLFPSRLQRSHKRWVRNRGDEVLKYAVDLGPDHLCLDVGGFAGDYTAAMRKLFGCRVHVYEPQPEFARKLVARFQCDPSVKVCPYGLGGITRKATICDTGDGTSLFTKQGGTEVEICSVIDELAKPENARVDMMKINIEGAEFELLECLLESPRLFQVKRFLIQFHDFIPNASERMCAIRNSLACHYSCEWSYDFIWESWVIHEEHAK